MCFTEYRARSLIDVWQFHIACNTSYLHLWLMPPHQFLTFRVVQQSLLVTITLLCFYLRLHVGIHWLRLKSIEHKSLLLSVKGAHTTILWHNVAAILLYNWLVSEFWPAEARDCRIVKSQIIRAQNWVVHRHSLSHFDRLDVWLVVWHRRLGHEASVPVLLRHWYLSPLWFLHANGKLQLTVFCNVHFILITDF